MLHLIIETFTYPAGSRMHLRLEDFFQELEGWGMLVRKEYASGCYLVATKAEVSYPTPSTSPVDFLLGGQWSRLIKKISISSITAMHMNMFKMLACYSYRDSKGRFEIKTTPNGNGLWHSKLELPKPDSEIASLAIPKFRGILVPLLEDWVSYVLASQIIGLARNFQDGSNPGAMEALVKKAEQIKDYCSWRDVPGM